MTTLTPTISTTYLRFTAFGESPQSRSYKLIHHPTSHVQFITRVKSKRTLLSRMNQVQALLQCFQGNRLTGIHTNECAFVASVQYINSHFFPLNTSRRCPLISVEISANSPDSLSFLSCNSRCRHSSQLARASLGSSVAAL